LLSVLGFTVTIWGVLRSKKAAEAAATSANQTQERLRNLDTVMDFSSAITIMEEIKRHHRGNNWHILPDRYSTLRGKLISIKSDNAVLEKHKTAIQNAISQFSDMERNVEKSLQDSSQLKIAKLNDIVSVQIDSLNEVLSEIKSQVKINNYGR
jgi:hypothetical protein